MRLDPETLLNAYAHGVFPMGDESGRIRWYSANPRGIMPLDAFHIPQTLRQTVRQGKFDPDPVTANKVGWDDAAEALSDLRAKTVVTRARDAG